MFSAQAAEEAARILSRYPEKRSALLPLLHIASREFEHLSPEALEYVAALTGLPKAHVRGVASFHVMFREKPGGRHLVQMCTNVSCMLGGSSGVLDALKERFGLVPGGTSSDGRFTLIDAECIGECEKAPAMIVDSDVYSNLTPEKAVSILEKYS